MVNFEEIDDWDDLLEDAPDQEPQIEEEPQEDSVLDDPEVTEDDQIDIITSLLQSKGVNPDSIKFKNEDGDIEEKSFYDLTAEEQLQILSYDDSKDNYGLEDEEIQLINQLRDNNLTVAEYNQYIAQQAVQNYIESQTAQQTVYTVDSIPDDELYLIDLKARIPDISDDDALTELELAQQNESLWQRKVQNIREEYQQRENSILEQQQQEAAQKAQEQAKQFEDLIVDTIQKNDTIDLGESSLSLSNDDKEEIASFILDSDVAGNRYIAKALNDPQTLVKMVWYSIKGEEAFGQISDYYKQKIAEAAKTNYNKGYEDAKAGRTANSAKSVVKKASRKASNKPMSIDDIDF